MRNESVGNGKKRIKIYEVIFFLINITFTHYCLRHLFWLVMGSLLERIPWHCAGHLESQCHRIVRGSEILASVIYCEVDDAKNKGKR